jgi:hypothetical protein
MTTDRPRDALPQDPEVWDSPEVAALIKAVPEFVYRYLDLVEQADGVPGPEAVFAEYADFVSDAACRKDGHTPVTLARLAAPIETVAATSDDAEDLIGWSFLDYLSLEARQAILPLLGPSTLAILETVESPTVTD